MDNAVNNLVNRIKLEMTNVPQTTKVVEGITVPQWLPVGSATDQAALLIVGLIPYCQTTGDATIKRLHQKISGWNRDDAGWRFHSLSLFVLFELGKYMACIRKHPAVGADESRSISE
jgi:hypothetical protein